MTLEEALKIIDPGTCHEALAVYAGDCDMLHAKAVEASHMVVEAYKAARSDIEHLTTWYHTRCDVCVGGLSGSCNHQPEIGDLPTCEDCGACICAGCTLEDSHFKWRGET